MFCIGMILLFIAHLFTSAVRIASTFFICVFEVQAFRPQCFLVQQMQETEEVFKWKLTQIGRTSIRQCYAAGIYSTRRRPLGAPLREQGTIELLGVLQGYEWKLCTADLSSFNGDMNQMSADLICPLLPCSPSQYCVVPFLTQQEWLDWMKTSSRSPDMSTTPQR